MGINIVIDNKVRFKVEGTVRDGAGLKQPFDFWLTCRRMNADEIKARLGEENDSSIFDFLVDVIEDWSGPRNADGAMAYSVDGLRELCRIPGVAAIAFRTYLAEVGAREKN